MAGLFSSSRGGLFSRRSAGSGGSLFPTSTRSPWATSSDQPSFELSDLDPVQLAELQASLSKLNLRKEPKGGGGPINFLRRAADLATPDLLGKALRQVAEGLIYTPAGMYETARRVGTDVGEALRYGDFSPERTIGLGQAMGTQIAEDIRHPLRNPGYLALDVWAAASLGSGGVARFGRGMNAARAARLEGGGPALHPPEAPLPRGPGPAGAARPYQAAANVTVPLQDSFKELARSLDDPARELWRPAELTQITDNIAQRTLIDKPTNAHVQSLLDQVAPRGSEKAARMEGLIQEAFARNTPIVPPRAPTLHPIIEGEQIPLIPGQIEIPSYQLAQTREAIPFAEQLKRFSEQVEGRGLQDKAMPMELESVLDDLMKTPEWRALPPEDRVAAANRLWQDFEAQMRDPAYIAQLKKMAEGAPSGLAAQRTQAAREITGAADEAKTQAGYLKEVGFRREPVPGRLTAAEEPLFARKYSIRYTLKAKKGRSKLVEEPKNVGRVHDEEGRPTNVTFTNVIPDEKGRTQVRTYYKVMVDGTPVGSRVRVRQGGVERTIIQSPNFITRKSAEYNAKVTAAELARGVPRSMLGLAVGDTPVGKLPDGRWITANDAARMGREQVMARNQLAKEKKAKRKRETEDVDDELEMDIEDDLELEDDLIDLDDELELETPEGKVVPTTYRDETPPDTPIEQTPPVGREQREFVKEQVPDEIKQDVEDIYDDFESAPREAPAEAPPAAPSLPRQPSRPTRRELGESDRALGINPRALQRAGLTREQGNQLREPLRELHEKYGSKTTIDDIADVISEELGINPADAMTMAQKMSGAEKVMAAGDVEMVKGSLLNLFKKELTPDQAAEASARWKEKVKPYMQELRESGRGPQKSELLSMLKEEFGDELGGKLFGRLYRVKGGSGESAARAFFKAFFGPRPYELGVLTKPMEGEKAAPGQEGLFTMEGKREAVAIELSQNPVRKAFQRWYYDWLSQAPEGGARARARNRKFAFEVGEGERVQEYLRLEGLTAEQALAETPEARPRTFGDVIDTTNQLAQIGVLYMKPAYIPPNMLGQIMFTTIDHALNPLAIARSFKLHSELAKLPDGKALVSEIRAGVGSGMYQGIAPERGAIRSVAKGHEKIARFYSKFMDNPFRDAAFMNEAWKRGYTTAERIAELVQAQPGTPLYSDLIRAYRASSRNLVDYGRLTAFEKRYVRRAIFFYPWIKGSTIWTGRALSEHPAAMFGMISAGRVGQERAREILGEVPSYMRGIIPIGKRNVPGLGEMPTVFNPAAMSVTGSGGEFLNAISALAFGGTTSEQLSEYLTPALSAGLAAVTRTDPFTGAQYDQGESFMEIAMSELGQSMPFMRALSNVPGVPEAIGIEPGRQQQIEEGTLDPSETLMPTSRKEELLRFATGLAPVTYNVAEGQERAVAEDIELRSRGEGSVMRWKQKIEMSRTAAQKAGVIKGKFPPHIERALAYQAKRDREYELVASSMGVSKSDLHQIDRLRADIEILVREKKMAPNYAQAILQNYARFSDDTISRYRRTLRDTYMGADVLWDYRAILEAQGVDPSLLRGWVV